jgi:hypothetical protein
MVMGGGFCPHPYYTIRTLKWACANGQTVFENNFIKYQKSMHFKHICTSEMILNNPLEPEF